MRLNRVICGIILHIELVIPAYVTAPPSYAPKRAQDDWPPCYSVGCRRSNPTPAHVAPRVRRARLHPRGSVRSSGSYGFSVSPRHLQRERSAEREGFDAVATMPVESTTHAGPVIAFRIARLVNRSWPAEHSPSILHESRRFRGEQSCRLPAAVRILRRDRRRVRHDQR
jgi:hypothetical protein